MKLSSTLIQVCRGGLIPYFRMNAPFFSATHSFLKITAMPESTKWYTKIMSTLFLQNYPQGYILSYFYKLLRLLSFFRKFVEFSLKHIYLTMFWGDSQIYDVQVTRFTIMHLEVEKKLNLDILPMFLGKHFS